MPDEFEREDAELVNLCCRRRVRVTKELSGWQLRREYRSESHEILTKQDFQDYMKQLSSRFRQLDHECCGENDDSDGN